MTFIYFYFDFSGQCSRPMFQGKLIKAYFTVFHVKSFVRKQMELHSL